MHHAHAIIIIIIIIGDISFVSVIICRFTVYEHAACMLLILNNELDVPTVCSRLGRALQCTQTRTPFASN